MQFVSKNPHSPGKPWRVRVPEKIVDGKVVRKGFDDTFKYRKDALAKAKKFEVLKTGVPVDPALRTEIEAIKQQYINELDTMFNKGDLSKAQQWEPWLRKKYPKKWSAIAKRFNNLGIETPKEYIFNRSEKLADQLVIDFNKGEKHIKRVAVMDKLPFNKTTLYNNKKIYAALQRLEPLEKKFNKVFNNILTNKDMPLIPPTAEARFGGKNLLTRIISDRVGKVPNLWVPFYNKHKFVKDNREAMTHAFRSSAQVPGETFAEMLAEGKERIKGGVRWTGTKGKTALGGKRKIIFDYAKSHWAANEGKGLVKLYNKAGTEEIKFKHGLKLNPARISFKIPSESQVLWDWNNVVGTLAKQEGIFDEAIARYTFNNDFLKEPIRHPITNKMVTHGELLQDAYKEGYGYKVDKQQLLNVDHTKGVKLHPYKGLRAMDRRMNTALGAVNKWFEKDKFSKKLKTQLTNDILGNLAGKRGTAYENILRQNLIKEASDILVKEKVPELTPYYTALAKQAPTEVFSELSTKDRGYVQRGLETALWHKGREGPLSKSLQSLRSLVIKNKALCGIVKASRATGGGASGGDQSCPAIFDADPDAATKAIAESPARGGLFSRAKNMAVDILKKVPKGGRLGAILAGAGAVGAGTWAMMGDATAEEAPTTDDMTYNATTGTFDNVDGDPETQEGILNWIADHPTASGFAALPGAIGLGYIASTAADKGKIPKVLGNMGKYMMSWKVGIPAMMIPHKLHEWKRGDEAAELITDPWNALWAVGIRSKGQLKEVEDYYKKAKNAGLNMNTLKNLKSVQGWKNLPGAFKTALMSPAATGTNWAMGTAKYSLRRPFVGAMEKLGALGEKDAAGRLMKTGIGAMAKRIGLRAALLPLGVLGAVPAGIATLGFLAADFAYGQYKDWRDGKAITDKMLQRGNITQEDADNYMTLIKQGSIPFGLGNRMFGSDNMTIAGQDLNADQQRQTLAGLESSIDMFQDDRQDLRKRLREDDFDFGEPGGFFSEGGRVGMKLGGQMDRREFMKWLLGIAAAGGAAIKGVWKPGAKQVAEEVVKQIPKEFAGVAGMPEWFFRAVQKIKASGKLVEMADKQYVGGDKYEMVLPIKVRKFDTVGGKEVPSGWGTEMKKVTLEENPLDGTIGLSWKSLDEYGNEIPRFINYKPGSAGYQKFGVDDPEAAAQGITEFRRVKVEEPEFEYGQPDYSSQGPEDTGPDSAEYLDIFTEGDSVVEALEKLAGKKIINKETEAAEKEIQKNIYKDIEGEEQIIPEPEGVGISDKGDVYGEEQFNEIIEGVVPDHLKKKAEGGIIETGNIARRPGAVPPLSGPTPQGSGIVGLFSSPKQVNVA